MGLYYTGVAISLSRVCREARACRLCEDVLPQAPRPVFRAGARARVLIVGQAPGRRVHETGIPWNDPSGEVLREWLALGREAFYDRSRIAIVPAGLCYPGTVDGADLPPPRRCAPTWQPRFRAALPRIELTLLVGAYAQRHYLQDRLKPTLTQTVRAFRDYLPEFLPLPHPSWRNKAWLRNNPWFSSVVVPELRRRIRNALRDV
jgi:uracil-DNA glycosylase